MNVITTEHDTDRVRRGLLYGLLSISLFYVLFFLFFVPKYATTDDVLMSMIASGTSMVPRPDEHLLFTNVLIGQILMKLYGSIPDLPWYDLYIFSVQVLSTFCLFFCIISTGLSTTRFFFFLAFILIVQMKFLIDPQFTTTAFMASLSGIFLFMSSLQHDGKQNWPLMLASGTALFISSLIRMEMTVMAAVLSAPMLLAETLNRFSRKRLMITAAYISLVVILIFGAHIYNRKYYENDPAWNNFYRMNKLSTQITDYSGVVYTSETKKYFDDIGWSSNDYLMFRNWFFADKNLYNAGKLSGLLSHFQNRWRWKPIKEIFPPIRSMIGDPGFLFIIGMYLTGIIYCGTRRNFSAILITFLAALLLIVYLAFFLKLPSRIYSSIGAFLAFQSVFLTTRPLFSKEGNAKFRVLGASVLILLTTLSAARVYAAYQAGDTRLANRARLTETLQSNISRSKLLFFNGDSFPSNMAYLPLRNTEYFRALNILCAGPVMYTPLIDALMNKFNIGDIYRALYANDRILLVSQPAYLPLYAKYVKEHYNVDIGFRIYTGNDLFVICKPFIKYGN